MLLKRFLRPWLLAAAALFAVCAFGALVQAGLLAPHFGESLSGRGGFGTGNLPAYTTTLRNESWRSWTLTSIRLANGKSTQDLPDGSSVQLAGVLHGQLGIGSAQAPELLPMSVGPDQQFTVVLVQHHQRSCSQPLTSQSNAQTQRYVAALQSLQYRVPVAIDVSTPLGTRSITMNFDISYGCPP